MAQPMPDRLAELVRARAFARLQVLSADERTRCGERASELERELGVRSPLPQGQAAQSFAWAMTMQALEELRPALQEGPTWLVRGHADEERRRLLALAEAEIAILQACVDRKDHGRDVQPHAIEKDPGGGPRNVYDLDSLLAAFVDHVRVGCRPRSDRWYRRFEPWYAHVLASHCLAFGVSFEENGLPSEKRADLLVLKRVVLQEVALPFPTKGAHEAGLLLARWPRKFDALFEAVRQATCLYRSIAREAAIRVWGDLGTRTHAQLVAAGLGRMPEPKYEYTDDEAEEL